MREHPVTRAAADRLAARRLRAITQRSATLNTAGVDLDGARVHLSGAGVDLPGTEDRPAAGPAAGRADLVVLLPSTDAATVLLLCAQAAEPSA